MPELSANLAALPNFGPKSREMLARADIHTLEQLLTLGAVPAYVRVKRSGTCASLNLLWAIEGVLAGKSWRDVARDDRLRLLLALEAEEASQAAMPWVPARGNTARD